MSDIQLSTIILEQGIDAYMEFCKQNPDALPIAVDRYENAMSYAVGFWWLSLDDRTKTAQLEKHPVFAEKYSEKTCRTYGSVCKAIPTSNRVDVVQNISIKTAMQITDHCKDDPTELEFWFNLALNIPQLSARNLEMLIKAKKETPEIMPYVVGELPKQVAGKLNDKTKKDRLQSLLATAKEQYKPTIVEVPIDNPELINSLESLKVENESLLDQNERLKARLKNVETESQKILDQQSESYQDQIKKLTKEVKGLKDSQKKEQSKLESDPDLLAELQKQLIAKDQELTQLKKEQQELKNPETKPEYKNFSAYEIDLAERVLKGETVVSAMFQTVNPYDSAFLKWVQKMKLGVKIDRSSKDWGNPFVVGEDGDLSTVLESYADFYFPRKFSLHSKLKELKGKVLLCWCKKPNKHIKGEAKDQPCHGDILADYANEIRRIK